jgi:glutaminyl-peptide cyclotransferase
VVGWIDCTGLLSPTDVVGGEGAVLNGIAYDAAADRLFVTGKLWPRLFEIKLVKRSAR